MRPDMFHVDIAPDGAATVHGIEQPVGEAWEPTPAYVLRGEADTIRRSLAEGWTVPLIVKVPTQSYWAGRGLPRGTAGAEFQVFVIREVPAEQPARVLRVRAERIVSVPLRRRKSDR